MVDSISNYQARIAAAQLYPGYNGGQSSSSSGDFASMLSLQTGQADGYGLLQSGGLRDGLGMVMSLNDSTSIRDGLVLLCRMMASGMSGSSSVMQALPVVAAALKDLPEGTIADLRQYMLEGGYGYGYEAADKVNQMLFARQDKNYPYSASKPVTPTITSDESDRSAQRLRAVLNQFNVTSNPRYAVNKKGENDTYCNIFVWDATLALGAEIPHYYNAATGEPRSYPDVSGANEMNANAMYAWPRDHGDEYGGRSATPGEAQLAANMGQPAVTAWRNPDGHGHVQMVCPSTDGMYDPERGVTVAQAGSRLFNYVPITQIYGSSSLENVTYYIHD